MTIRVTCDCGEVSPEIAPVTEPGKPIFTFHAKCPGCDLIFHIEGGCQ